MTLTTINSDAIELDNIKYLFVILSTDDGVHELTIWHDTESVDGTLEECDEYVRGHLAGERRFPETYQVDVLGLETLASASITLIHETVTM